MQGLLQYILSTQNHLKLKSGDISSVHNIHFRKSIANLLRAQHYYHRTQPCKWEIKKWIINKLDFEFKLVSRGYHIYIFASKCSLLLGCVSVALHWFSCCIWQCHYRAYMMVWDNIHELIYNLLTPEHFARVADCNFDDDILATVDASFYLPQWVLSGST